MANFDPNACEPPHVNSFSQSLTMDPVPVNKDQISLIMTGLKEKSPPWRRRQKNHLPFNDVDKNQGGSKLTVEPPDFSKLSLRGPSPHRM